MLCVLILFSGLFLICGVMLLLLLFFFLFFFLMNQGGIGAEGWSNAGWLGPPSGFVAGRPRAALLFWFFGGFGCGVPLFVVVLVVYWYKGWVKIDV